MRELRYVCSIESFPNCPTHDGGSFSGLQNFNSLKEMLNFALKNINEEHITDCLSYDDRKYEFFYQVNTNNHHSFSDIHLVIDSEMRFRIIDDGRGNKIWESL